MKILFGMQPVYLSQKSEAFHIRISRLAIPGLDTVSIKLDLKQEKCTLDRTIHQ